MGNDANASANDNPLARALARWEGEGGPGACPFNESDRLAGGRAIMWITLLTLLIGQSGGTPSP
jgi:hypothetical protein